MKRRSIFLPVILTCVLTILLYQPTSLIIYKIREPRFARPIKSAKSQDIIIRSDARGDGNFGAKRRNGRSHSGIDIVAPIGTKVCAAKSGIAFRGNVPTGYGKYIMIYHPDGFQTIYGHLSDWNVDSTVKVRKGAVIGFVGKTGNAANKSIEPHLHFEIRKKGEPEDPRGLMER